ncbi:hypothetical protein SAMD00023353_3800400 [Rosellinia necatrix]|uniref:Uncharacterized protein n=1 Tax=Rosellinia necatrix TaxID=77044 RepID=A0A1S8A947_ROSNE|nr:hypothetical protein SAMD00023353_3800400 [Rosellinia necatrix]
MRSDNRMYPSHSYGIDTKTASSASQNMGNNQRAFCGQQLDQQTPNLSRILNLPLPYRISPLGPASSRTRLGILSATSLRGASGVWKHLFVNTLSR